MAKRGSRGSKKEPEDASNMARVPDDEGSSGGEGIGPRDEISRVKSEHEAELLGLPNVTGVFTDFKTTGGRRTGTLSIVVTVSQKKDVAAKDRIPAEINGIPTDVIEEEIVPMQAAMLLDEVAPAIDTTNYPTLQGGISIGPCRSIYLEPPDAPSAGNYVFVGTLGCIVRDNTTNDPMMLSNFHVMCVNDGWSAGDTMAQPSRVDGGSCPADVVGTLARAQLDSAMDAAVATISGRPHECSIVDIGDVKGTATAAAEMAVRKRGRTTELTHGRITATDYTTNVDYGDGLGTVTLTNQIRIVNDPAQSDFFGKKGDSGSVVVNDDERVVGLYFAGNSTGTVGVANPIGPVLTALGVTLCTAGPKLLKEFSPKEFAKEFGKDVVPEKFRKLEIKELEKERLKDVIKDWKEFAYEKFGAFESYQPWERLPRDIYQPRGPLTPKLPQQPFLPTRPGSLEERLARLEGALGMTGGQQMEAAWDVRPEGGCLDFGRLAEGAGPNPISAPPFDITVLDYTGASMAQTTVSNWGSHTGLNAGWTLEARLAGRCPVVQATLVHFVQGATLEAWNADGSYAGSSSMAPTQNVAQTLTIHGTAIARVRITSPQNETLLLKLCCCADVQCMPAEDRKPPKEWKEFKEKEWKESIKEWKEPKELKEQIKELREPKELLEPKELYEPKQFKEPKELKDIREGGIGEFRPPDLRDLSTEERLARLEGVLGGSAHFIPPDARPDLGRGALKREPDEGGRSARKRRGR